MGSLFLGCSARPQPQLPLAHAFISPPHCTNTQSADDTTWHLLALTTRPEGGKGYQLYVDGALAAEAEEGQLYTGALSRGRRQRGQQGLWR